MTVRECIEKMRKVGAYTIRCNNGTYINIIEIGEHPDTAIGKIKIIDGKRILRSILCHVSPADCTDFSFINNKKYKMFDPDYTGYQYFREGVYCIPEREMNMFINANGGIDIYSTISVPGFMLSDSMALLNM